METVPHHPLIKVTLENLKNARNFYNMPSRQTVGECLENVKEWCAKQEHLQEANKHLSLDVLERIFLLARFSTEGTKIKIDRLFTSRALMPELFLKRTVKEFEPLWNCIHHCPLPKMTTDQSRILATQFKTEKLDDFNLLSYFRYAFLIGEYRLFYDYCLSETVILDLKNVNLGVLSKLNPVVVKKAEILCTEVFGTRIKGIHILNAPPFVDRVVFLLKQALREKVASRLHVHNSYEDFYKFVPKEILPADYGGDEKSLAKLSAKEYLERCLIMNKGSVERTKTKLDKMCTMRNLLPQFFNTIDVRRDFEPYAGKIKHAVLPHLTTKQERMYIIKGDTFKYNECLSCYRGMIKVCEFIRAYDYNCGIVAVIDYSDMNIMELLPKLNPVELHQFINLVSDTLSLRLKSLHLISTSKMIEVVVNLLKSAMSAKLADRVFVHKNYEELRKSMNEEDVFILPKEYGGSQRCLNELNDEFTNAMSSEDFVNHLKDLLEAVTDEQLRPSAAFNNQYLGAAGSFRVINVD